MKPIQVYLEESEVKRLKKLAIDKGITLSDLIRLYIDVKHKVADSINNDFKYGDGSGKPASFTRISETIIKTPEQAKVVLKAKTGGDYCKHGYALGNRMCKQGCR